jgi:hypothetical protein
MCIGLHVKYPLFLLNFKKTWMFSTYFRKILKYQISWKPVLWEPSCSMRTDGQTDMTNIIVEWRNFAKAPKKIVLVCPPSVKDMFVESSHCFLHMCRWEFCAVVQFCTAYIHIFQSRPATWHNPRNETRLFQCLAIHSLRSLSCERSIASSKASTPENSSCVRFPYLFPLRSSNSCLLCLDIISYFNTHSTASSYQPYEECCLRGCDAVCFPSVWRIEHGGTNVFRDMCNYLPIRKALYLRKQLFSHHNET